MHVQPAALAAENRSMAALREMTDVMMRSGSLDTLIPAVLRIVGRALDAHGCGYFEVSPDGLIHGRHWYIEDQVLAADGVAEAYDAPLTEMQWLAEGFLSPPGYLSGQDPRRRTHSVQIDHLQGSAAPAFDRLLRPLGWDLELNVPIIILGESPATLCIYRSADAPYTPDDCALADMLAGQLGVALAARHMAHSTSMAAAAQEREATTNRHLAVYRAVAASAELLTSTPELHEILPQVCRLLGEATGVDRVHFFQHDAGAAVTHLVAEWCREGRPSMLSVTASPVFCDADYPEVLEPMLAGRVYCSPLECKSGQNYELNRLTATKADLHVPIMQDGVFWGMINFDDCTGGRTWEDGEIDILRTAAAVISAALKRRSIEHERKRLADQRAELLQTVSSITRSLLDTTDPIGLLPRVLALLAHATGTDRACLLMEEDGPEGFVHRVGAEWVAEGFPAQEQSSAAVIPNSFIPKRVLDDLHSGTSMLLDIDDSDDPFMAEQRSLNVVRTGACGIFVDGRYWGALAFDICREGASWSDTQIRAIEIAANGIAAALQQHRTIQRSAEALAREQQAAAETRASELVHANEVLRQSVERLHSLGSLDAVLDTFLSEAMRITGASSGGIFERVGTSGATFTMRTFQPGPVALRPLSHPPDPSPTACTTTDEDGLGVLQEVVAGHAVVVAVDDRFAAAKPVPYAYHSAAGHRIIWHFPFRAGGVVRGYLGLAFREAVLPPTVIETTIALSHQASVALEILHLSESARHAAIADERNRLAREIHDTLAQCLTGVIMQLQAANELADQDPSVARDCIGRAEALAREGLAEARRSVRTLRTDVGPTLDLPTALTDIVQRTTTGTPIMARVEVLGEQRPLPPAVAMQVLRIGQEGFTNALRHADARKVIVTLQYLPGAFRLAIEDDGRGFDEAAARASAGFGLIGMRQRAEQIGGRLTVATSAQFGTLLELQIALA